MKTREQYEDELRTFTDLSEEAASHLASMFAGLDRRLAELASQRQPERTGAEGPLDIFAAQHQPVTEVVTKLAEVLDLGMYQRGHAYRSRIEDAARADIAAARRSDAETIARLRGEVETKQVQLDYLHRVWERIFALIPSGPNDDHPEHVNHVLRVIEDGKEAAAELEELRALVTGGTTHFRLHAPCAACLCPGCKRLRTLLHLDAAKGGQGR